jgi:hypothetical protein
VGYLIGRIQAGSAMTIPAQGYTVKAEDDQRLIQGGEDWANGYPQDDDQAQNWKA